METTTVGKILLKSAVPQQYHAFVSSHELDKKNVGQLFKDIAHNHPEHYKDAASRLARLGFETSTRLGSTVRLSDLLPPIDKAKRFAELDKEIDGIKAQKLSHTKETDAVSAAYHRFGEAIDKEIIEVGRRDNKTLAKVILAGARGSATQYRQTVFAPISVNDAKGGVLTEFPVRNSFAEGLSLPEYLAHTFGARAGAISTKLAVAESGYFCLSGETEVRMGDLTTKKIQDIQPGDCVLGADISGKTFPSRVVNHFKNGVQPTHIYRFRKYESESEFLTVRATVGHKLLVDTPRGKKAMGRLEKLDFAVVLKGVSVELYQYACWSECESTEVFDIEVDNDDHLYVLANGLIVSNSKQLSRSAMTTIVEEHDCGTANGIDVPVSDRDSIGCFLARPVDGFKRNNEVSAVMLNQLRDHRIDTVNVRSVVTCEAPSHFHSGAVCQLCCGRRDKGLPPIGDYVGLTAGSTLGESMSQGSLNVKHQGGSARKKSEATGFKLINQLANIPDTFKDKAPLTAHDGEVVQIRPAPQGGNYVDVKTADKTEEYYIPEGLDVKVSLRQKLEAGDVLSEGIINPAEVVQYKGIGEGRRYFAHTLREAFEHSGLGGVNRKNFELIAKGVIDHVRITNNEGVGDYLPGSIVSYHNLVRGYQVRPGTSTVRPDFAFDKYLEEPVLHYTIGTRVTHSIIDNLRKHHIDAVKVNAARPDFEPEMQRLLDIPIHEHDWMHQLYSTNLERRLLDAVNNGAVSNIKGPSPVPGLAFGQGFGLK